MQEDNLYAENDGAWTSEEDEREEWDFEACGLSYEEPSDAHTHTRGEFFGCYLLVSKNAKCAGRTYIGFTVDPNRRLKQHNAGHHMGGAKKTSGRGPWEMVLIVHGFHNEIAALRFEWAWQHPHKSRRLGKGVARKKPRETPLQYRFRTLAEMLSVGPWCRLALTIRWLRQEYEMAFPLQRQPPAHMPIAYGPVDICRARGAGLEDKGGGAQGVAVEEEEEKSQDDGGSQKQSQTPCCLCFKDGSSLVVFRCYHEGCSMSAHATCLAPRLCEVGQLLPVGGACPSCSRELLWGEMVRRSGAVTGGRQRGGQDTVSSSQPKSRRRKAKPPATRATTGHWTEALHLQETTS